MAEFIRSDCPRCGRANVNQIDSLPPIQNVITKCARCGVSFTSAWSRVGTEAVGQECLDCGAVSSDAREAGKGCAGCGSYRRAAFALFPASG